MNLAARIEDRIAEKYTDLSAKLKDAADFVVSNQVDVAARSLRSVSVASGVSPATLSRLARALGFESYEDMRELCRSAVGNRNISFADRAERLKDEAGDSQAILDKQAAACVWNVTELAETIDRGRLEQAVKALRHANGVVLFGAFSSTGVVEYMAYLANFFCCNWTLAGRMGASLGATLSDIGPEEVLLIVTKTPYARRAVLAAKMATEAGAQTIVITDSHACPANKYATFSFIVPSDSPQFFSSYAATLMLIETMIAMIVAQSGVVASDRIRGVESRNQSLGDFWAD